MKVKDEDIVAYHSHHAAYRSQLTIAHVASHTAYQDQFAARTSGLLIYTGTRQLLGKPRLYHGLSTWNRTRIGSESRHVTCTSLHVTARHYTSLACHYTSRHAPCTLMHATARYCTLPARYSSGKTSRDNYLKIFEILSYYQEYSYYIDS